MNTSTPASRRAGDLLNRVRAWIGRNPLHLFRAQQDVTLTEAATIIGVSLSTIQQWEAGARTPKPEHLKKISRLIGRDVATAWKSWSGSRPQQ